MLNLAPVTNNNHPFGRLGQALSMAALLAVAGCADADRQAIVGMPVDITPTSRLVQPASAERVAGVAPSGSTALPVQSMGSVAANVSAVSDNATDAIESCGEGLVLLMQSTTTLTDPYKVTYHRLADGCYVTREIGSQPITSRAFFGVVHVLPIDNPKLVEAGFSSIILDNKKEATISVSTSRLGVPFIASNRLFVIDNNPYSIKGIYYPSVKVDCTTTNANGKQIFHSTMTFGKIPGTNFIFQEDSTADVHAVWGAEKVLEILSLPKTSTVRPMAARPTAS